MKTKFLFLLFCLSMHQNWSQIRALTENGDLVVLYQDNSWKYIEEQLNQDIATSKAEFTRSENAGKFYKSEICNPYGVYVDNAVWKSVAKGKEEIEFSFQLRVGEGYATALFEKTPITIESLRQTVIENGLNAAPDLRILKEEYRMVNGRKVLMMQMQGTIQSIPFVYFGYFYTDGENTIQIITYSFRSAFDKYFHEFEVLLNGLDTLTSE